MAEFWVTFALFVGGVSALAAVWSWRQETRRHRRVYGAEAAADAAREREERTRG